MRRAATQDRAEDAETDRADRLEGYLTEELYTQGCQTLFHHIPTGPYLRPRAALHLSPLRLDYQRSYFEQDVSGHDEHRRPHADSGNVSISAARRWGKFTGGALTYVNDGSTYETLEQWDMTPGHLKHFVTEVMTGERYSANGYQLPPKRNIFGYDLYG